MRSSGKAIIFFACIVCGYASQNPLPDSVTPLYANYDGLDLMSDAPWVIKKDAFVFSNLFLNNDSIQMEKTQSDASRVTLGKIALEAIGGAAGGTATGLACAMIVGPREFWQGAATFTGITVGLAGGTTLVGNLVMEPNGSFIKSLIGSYIGTGLGTGVLFLTSLAYLGWEAGKSEGGPPLALIGISFASALSISGAVVGYNLKGSGCCLWGAKGIHNLETELSQTPEALFRVQIVSIKF